MRRKVIFFNFILFFFCFHIICEFSLRMAAPWKNQNTFMKTKNLKIEHDGSHWDIQITDSEVYLYTIKASSAIPPSTGWRAVPLNSETFDDGDLKLTV